MIECYVRGPVTPGVGPDASIMIRISVKSIGDISRLVPVGLPLFPMIPSGTVAVDAPFVDLPYREVNDRFVEVMFS